MIEIRNPAFVARNMALKTYARQQTTGAIDN